jgi:hypothetical protein
MTWAALFERAEQYDADAAAIREALADRRSREAEDDA